MYSSHDTIHQFTWHNTSIHVHITHTTWHNTSIHTYINSHTTSICVKWLRYSIVRYCAECMWSLDTIHQFTPTSIHILHQATTHPPPLSIYIQESWLSLFLSSYTWVISNSLSLDIQESCVSLSILVLLALIYISQVSLSLYIFIHESCLPLSLSITHTVAARNDDTYIHPE